MKPLLANEYLNNAGHVDINALREDLFDYFNTLHYMLSDTEFDEIAKYARDWITEHLHDEDTLHTSVRHKAHDISSGDHYRDYYQALLIRRDQLLAARDVFREYTRHLRDIFGENRDNVLESLRQFDFDQGIYLRALEYQKARESLASSYGEMLEDELSEVSSLIETTEEAMELESGDSVEAAPTKKRATRRTSATPKKKPTRFFHRNI